MKTSDNDHNQCRSPTKTASYHNTPLASVSQLQTFCLLKTNLMKMLHRLRWQNQMLRQHSATDDRTTLLQLASKEQLTIYLQTTILYDSLFTVWSKIFIQTGKVFRKQQCKKTNGNLFEIIKKGVPEKHQNFFRTAATVAVKMKRKDHDEVLLSQKKTA